MTGALPAGHVTTLPDLPGRWQVWSLAAESPGSYFFVPFDEESKEQGVKYVVGRAIRRRGEGLPVIDVLRIEKDNS